MVYGTRSENFDDAFRNGKMPCGSWHYNAKLTDEDVYEIIHLRKSGFVQSKIAKMFNVGQDQISRICSGKRWRYLKREEVFHL